MRRTDFRRPRLFVKSYRSCRSRPLLDPLDREGTVFPDELDERFDGVNWLG